MNADGRLVEAHRTLDGRLVLAFAVDQEVNLDGLFEKQLTITAEPYREKRSKNANAYFWVLCDKIAKKVNSTKDEIYLKLLSRYGTFTDVMMPAEAYPSFKNEMKCSEVIDEGSGTLIVRCYHGSSGYDTKEMSDLIEGTVSEAKELGIDTATPAEIEEMMRLWKNR